MNLTKWPIVASQRLPLLKQRALLPLRPTASDAMQLASLDHYRPTLSVSLAFQRRHQAFVHRHDDEQRKWRIASRLRSAMSWLLDGKFSDDDSGKYPTRAFLIMAATANVAAVQ